MAIPEGVQRFGELQDCFGEFTLVSGLLLNLPKTAVVPRYPHDVAGLHAQLSTSAPAWGGVAITDAAKYLGYYVGPGRGASSWDGPFRTYQERARLWGSLGFGMLLSLEAYSVYIASVLLFVSNCSQDVRAG